MPHTYVFFNIVAINKNLKNRHGIFKIYKNRYQHIIDKFPNRLIFDRTIDRLQITNLMKAKLKENVNHLSINKYSKSYLAFINTM